MPFKMPQIINCIVTECAYNSNNMCRAMAITVGSACAACDTFTKQSQKAGIPDATGSVGACKISSCKYNDALECTANGIHVGRHEDHAECNTFSPR